jgi:hypothetical protein
VIAIAILGLGVTSILGAVLIATSSSTLDQRQVQAQARLKSWAEKLNATGYVDCAGTGSYPAYTTFAAQTPPAPALPSGFHASYAEVRYWDTTSQQFVSSLTSCSGSPAKDQGVQRIRLKMTADPGLYPGFDTYLWVTVRKPCTALGTC